jgi:signal transduction histidine kinase
VSERRRSILFDLLVCGTVAGLGAFTWHEFHTALYAPLMALALLPRRRWPLASMAAVAAVALLQVLTTGAGRNDPLPYDTAVAIAMYSVVKYGRRLLDAYLAAGVVAVGIVVEVARHRSDGVNWWTQGGFYVAAFAGIWLSGYLVRTRRQYVAGLEERAATLERERQHLAQIAVARERATIAREMHDVVAHSLAVIIVQADGGRYAMAGDPERGGAVLETVAATARDALEEMGRLIDLLRAGEDTDDGDRLVRGLDELAALVERARHAGVDVTLSAAPVPVVRNSTVGVAAYRIVQEALTNVLRHAGAGARCAVTVEHDRDTVRISVVDDGAGAGGANPDGERGGHGLVGMRERAAVLGGTFDAGPRAGGGWRVHAVLPIPGAERAEVAA